MDVQQIQNAIGNIHGKNPYEVRVLFDTKVSSGIFTETEKLINSLENLKEVPKGIYMTMNPIMNPKIDNDLNFNISATKDSGILHRKYLLIDCDPVRPANVSSTNEEHLASIKKADEIANWLFEKGWSNPIKASSGNGAHLIYLIDEPNDETTTNLIKRVLASLNLEFSDDRVIVDKSVYNAARIWRLYGTTNNKGVSTNERPHRNAEILDVPQQFEVISTLKLKEVAEIAEYYSPSNNLTSVSDLDVTSILETIGIPFKEKSYEAGKRLFVWDSCPWNKDHTDKSAFLMIFDNQKVFAKCHHNGCSHQNWTTLAKKYGLNNAGVSQEKKSNAILLFEALREDLKIQFFKDQNEIGMVKYHAKEVTYIVEIQSSEFKRYLKSRAYKMFNKILNNETTNNVVELLLQHTDESDEYFPLFKRVMFKDNTIYYSLNDSQKQFVKIDASGYKIEPQAIPMFKDGNLSTVQIVPAEEGDYSLLFNHLSVQSKLDKVLLLVWVATCFIETVKQPLLLFTGEKGAAKSTSLSVLQSLVDPSKAELQRMPKNERDLVASLSNGYFVSFDNVSDIPDNLSDLLCQVITKGSFVTRTLYTNNSTSVVQLNTCVGITSIDEIIERSDLLDRSLIIELSRISSSNRKTSSKVWEDFILDKPKILAGIFELLSKAILVKPTITVPNLSRMADFAEWGFAIAECIPNYSGAQFMEEYKKNQSNALTRISFEDPLLCCLDAHMANQEVWQGSVQKLFEEIHRIGKSKSLSHHLPKAPHSLSRFLNTKKAEINVMGLDFSIDNKGNYKQITLVKK